MFKKKRKREKNSEIFRKAVETHLSPIIKRYGERLKIKRKIRIANIWARKHPKTLMASYLSFAFFLLALTISIDLLSSNTETKNALDFKSLPSMSHRFQSINNTEIQNEILRMEIGELGRKGQILYSEMDSLMKRPNKTQNDSVRILQLYNILNNTFNPLGHEHKEN